MHLYIGAETLLIPYSSGRPVGGGWMEWKRKKFLTDTYWHSPEMGRAIRDLGLEVRVFAPDAIVAIHIEREFDFDWHIVESFDDRPAACRMFQPVGDFAWIDNFKILHPQWTLDADDNVLLIDVPSYVRRIHIKEIRDWMLRKG